MKKVLLYSLLIAFILIFVKYRYSDYDIKYKVDGYDIVTKYEDKRIYYEIKKNTMIYNFDVYKRRSFNKNLITNVKYIEGEDFSCIYPVIKNVSTYPLCYKDGIYTDYYLIDSELLDNYKPENINIPKPDKDFVYYNNLSNDEYVALWNYKGYIVMNGNRYNNVILFKNDKYDNTLSYLIKDTLYIANYDEEHEYSKLITLNLKNLKTNEIKLDTKIDFDSYIVGNIKKYIYIYDNKHSTLYEINIKNGETTIKGNNEKGFVKYDGKHFVVCSKSDYKVNKITYNNSDSIYKYTINNGLYKSSVDNNKLNELIVSNNVKIINTFKNKLYYLDKDNFYTYIPGKGSELVFYNYELSFNDKNTIFVYMNN